MGLKVVNDHWMLLGDFNVCRNSSKMRGGTISLSLGMRRFYGFLSLVSLQDLAFSGPKLIWNNKRFGAECIF